MIWTFTRCTSALALFVCLILPEAAQTAPLSPCPRSCTCGTNEYLLPRTSFEKSSDRVFYDASVKSVIEIDCKLNTTATFNLSYEIANFLASHPNISGRHLDIDLECDNGETVLWADAEFLRKTIYFSVTNCRMTTNHKPLVFPNSTALDGFHLTELPSDVFFWDNLVFRGLERLRHLTFAGNNLTSFPGNIATVPMPKLHHFQIPNNQLTAIDCQLFNNTPQLLEFWANHNKIRRVPECVCMTVKTFFGYNNDKRRLWLENNEIEDISALSCDLPMPFVYLGYNKIVDLPVFGMKLSIINLDHNRLTFIPRGRFPDRGALTVINLNDNLISTIAPEAFKVTLYLLREVNLSGNALTEFKVEHAPEAQFIPMEIDLRRNRLQYPPMFDSESSNYTGSGARLTFYAAENDFYCDCNMREYKSLFKNNEGATDSSGMDLWNILSKLYNHAKTKLKVEFVDKSLWRCSQPEVNKGRKVVEVEISNSSCPVVHDCPKECSCVLHNDIKSIRVSCSNLTDFPATLPDFRDHRLHLNVSNNDLTQLPGRIYLTQLVELDATGNNIGDISGTALLQMSNIKALYIRNNNLRKLPKALLDSHVGNASVLTLGENPWDCSCPNEWFLKWMTSRGSVVTDVGDVTCDIPQNVRGQRFSDDVIKQLNCETKDDYMVMASTVGSITALLIIALVLVVIFRHDFKVILFVKWDIDLCARRAEEQSKDRPFDVFVSYSSLDGEWVRQKLLPMLEREHNPPFRTCFHERDFLPGAPIAENIMRAIQASKRTLMVVSKNFIASDWCEFEFLTAHKSFMETKQNKIIVVMLEGDVDTKSMDPMLRAYFTTKTFIRAADRLFKEKLYYAMPRAEKPNGGGNEMVKLLQVINVSSG